MSITLVITLILNTCIKRGERKVIKASKHLKETIQSVSRVQLAITGLEKRAK